MDSNTDKDLEIGINNNIAEEWWRESRYFAFVYGVAESFDATLLRPKK